MGTERQNLEALLPRGGKVARDASRKLTNPHEYPESLRYLHDWYHEVGEMTWANIAAWQQATGRTLRYEEIAALSELDRVVRHPEEPNG